MNAESKALTLSEYDRTKFNVLLPSTEVAQASQWHVLRVSHVEVATDPRAGDIYKAAGGGNDDDDRSAQSGPDPYAMYALAKPALMRIANAAGIQWDTRECKLISITRDYACYQAVGLLRGPDGTPRRSTQLKEIDLTVIEAEIRKRKGAIARKKNWSVEFTEQMIIAELLQWRKNKAMRAETGAFLRVIKQLLAMRSAYSMQELGRPFVVPRFDINYADADVRQMFVSQAAAAQAAMFGGFTPAAQPFVGEKVIDLTPEVEEREAQPPAGPAQESPDDTDSEADPFALPHDMCKGVGCGATGLPQPVVEYSNKFFGQTLCRLCQEKAKAARGGQARG